MKVSRDIGRDSNFVAIEVYRSDESRMPKELNRVKSGMEATLRRN